jgi:hypothetical protein
MRDASGGDDKSKEMASTGGERGITCEQQREGRYSVIWWPWVARGRGEGADAMLNGCSSDK